MRALKTHLQHEPEHRDHNWSVCRTTSVLYPAPLTFDRAAVTCKSCLRLSESPADRLSALAGRAGE